MNNFAIVTDSSCDINSSLMKKFGIDGVIRGVVYAPDGTQLLADIDWENISPEEFYTSMKGRNILYKTATPSAGEVLNVLEPVLQSGRDILTISLSSAISGTFQIVQTAANELLEKYPERKIVCVDSLRYASAAALLVTLASKKRKSGASIEETAEYLNEIKYSIHQMGPLDDLFFCVKTGRITNFQALFGTLIGVNSLADFSRKGMSLVVGKAKGKKAAFNATVNYITETIKNPEEQIIFIAHSNREESAKLLAEELKKRLNPKDIIINHIGMSCGASIGPGLYAAYYVGNPISEGEVDEKKTMESILKSKN